MKASNLTVSPGPHWHGGARITDAPYSVMIALIPAIIVSCRPPSPSSIGLSSSSKRPNRYLAVTATLTLLAPYRPTRTEGPRICRRSPTYVTAGITW